MAKFERIKPPKPIEITKFLGLNEAVGDTEIELGEAVRMENFRITKNYKPQKRNGHIPYIDGACSGMWAGVINGQKVLVFAANDGIYVRYIDVVSVETELSKLLTSSWDDSTLWDDSSTWDESANPAVVLLGAFVPVGQVKFLWFDSKLHIKDTEKWYTYDGTTFAALTPYIPTIAIESPPAGGGTLFEEINVLTGKKQQWFVGDNVATNYFLAETAITSVDQVYVNGVLQTAIVNYTVDLSLGRITFVSAPPTDADVRIFWTKGTGSPSLVLSHVYMVDYGIGNDTNIFVFGGSHEKATFRYSMVGNPAYFPANAFVVVGSDQFAITDMVSQQQQLLIYKEDSARIVDPFINPLFESNSGLNPYNFGYRDLNETVGNSIPGGVQLVKDSPVSVYGESVWFWGITSVESQRSADIISDRIKISLNELGEEAIELGSTFNYQAETEYWLCVGNKVFVWNYGNNTWYTYTNISGRDFTEFNGIIYYIADDGIRKFSNVKSDNGVTIPAKLYLGFTDFNSLQYRKMMRDEWLAIAPDARTSVTIKFITDRDEEVGAEPYKVEYRFLDFDDVDFNDFSFETNVNPQPKRLKAKVKKFTYLQVLFENLEDDESLTILKLLMNSQVQGYSR